MEKLNSIPETYIQDRKNRKTDRTRLLRGTAALGVLGLALVLSQNRGSEVQAAVSAVDSQTNHLILKTPPNDQEYRRLVEPIQLEAGWNLVVFDDRCELASQAFQPLIDEGTPVIAYGFNPETGQWQVYNSLKPETSNLIVLHPEQPLWVGVKQAVSWQP